MTATELLRAHTTGQMTFEEVNVELEKLHVGYRLDPNKNVIMPGEEDRFGLLITGTGSPDKVAIADWHMTNCDCGDMYAEVIFLGNVYAVRGTELLH